MIQLRLIAISTMQNSRFVWPVRMLTLGGGGGQGQAEVGVGVGSGLGLGLGLGLGPRLGLGLEVGMLTDRVVEGDGLVELSVEEPRTGGGEELV